MAKNVAGAIDAGSLAVPEAEHAVELAFAAQLGLLRAPQRGRSNVLVDAGLETDVVLVERTLGADELLVERAERRAAIAGDEARGVEAGATVALLLHQAEPDQRLEAGHKNPALGEVIFVVERDVVERHRGASNGGPLVSVPARRAARQGSFELFKDIVHARAPAMPRS